MNLVLDPLEREPLVIETCVRDCVVAEREAGATEPAEGAETVVGRNIDHRAGGVNEEVDRVPVLRLGS